VYSARACPSQLACLCQSGVSSKFNFSPTSELEGYLNLLIYGDLNIQPARQPHAKIASTRRLLVQRPYRSSAILTYMGHERKDPSLPILDRNLRRVPFQRKEASCTRAPHFVRTFNFSEGPYEAHLSRSASGPSFGARGPPHGSERRGSPNGKINKLQTPPPPPPSHLLAIFYSHLPPPSERPPSTTDSWYGFAIHVISLTGRLFSLRLLMNSSCVYLSRDLSLAGYFVHVV
jgi:hypothetical protein